jgi:hypothetical protein
MYTNRLCIASEKRVQCILFSIHIDFLLAEIIVFLRGWFGFVSNHALINFDHLLNKEAILYPLCLFSLSHIVRLPINIFLCFLKIAVVYILLEVSAAT